MLKTQDEFTCQTLLVCLLIVREPCASLEENSGDGRPDLIYDAPSGFSVVVEIRHDITKHAEKVAKLEKEPVAVARIPMFPDPPNHVKTSL
ncbi:MAG: hypothetical protein LBT40_01045 [Deltaproteobacteria bacterium]|jgi:hypothetical protein|nr:hypothetical protein [Deltaproteobacteria bacterium]